MEEIKCEQVGMLTGGKWDKLHDANRRVYSDKGISPTLTTMGGGQREVKILVPEATKKGYDTATYGDSINMAYPNSKTRRGRVGHGVAQTLTTGDSQQVVVEPLVWDGFNQSVRVDSTVCGTITRNVGADLKRNGQGIIESSYRIRKLTERECGRLMGVKGDDCNRIAENQATSSQYHLYGDSIVTTCLMAIFGELLSVDYKTKINELVGELKQS